jgi:hypothetical protein
VGQRGEPAASAAPPRPAAAQALARLRGYGHGCAGRPPADKYLLVRKSLGASPLHRQPAPALRLAPARPLCEDISRAADIRPLVDCNLLPSVGAIVVCPTAGIGIAERGLRSLFKEYVQGSEEDMRRPRSRGGTGLGLSICCKQVGARLPSLPRTIPRTISSLCCCYGPQNGALCLCLAASTGVRASRCCPSSRTTVPVVCRVARHLQYPVAQVAVLGGQIGAMSKQGLGSTFWFTVPLQLAESPRPR